MGLLKSIHAIITINEIIEPNSRTRQDSLAALTDDLIF